MSQRIIRLYHGSSVEFDIFNRSGVRSTSALGVGHYLTPSLEKAKQYGNIVMIFDVDVTDCLDWNNLTTHQRNDIENFLLSCVPHDRIAHYGQIEYELIPLNKDGEKRFAELKKLTDKNYSDASKVRFVLPSDIPKHIANFDNEKFTLVKWKTSDSLISANTEQILALCQEYCPEIASLLGYSGAMFSSEICIYSNTLAKKVEVEVEQKLKSITEIAIEEKISDSLLNKKPIHNDKNLLNQNSINKKSVKYNFL